MALSILATWTMGRKNPQKIFIFHYFLMQHLKYYEVVVLALFEVLCTCTILATFCLHSHG